MRQDYAIKKWMGGNMRAKKMHVYWSKDFLENELIDLDMSGLWKQGEYKRSMCLWRWADFACGPGAAVNRTGLNASNVGKCADLAMCADVYNSLGRDGLLNWSACPPRPLCTPLSFRLRHCPPPPTLLLPRPAPPLDAPTHHPSSYPPPPAPLSLAMDTTT